MNRYGDTYEDDDLSLDDSAPYQSIARAGALINEEAPAADLEEDAIYAGGSPAQSAPPIASGGAAPDLMGDYDRQQAVVNAVRKSNSDRNADVNIYRSLAQLAGSAGSSPVKTDLYDSMIKQNTADSAEYGEDMKSRSAVMRAIQLSKQRADAASIAGKRSDERFDETKRHNVATESALAASRGAAQESKAQAADQKREDKDLALAVPGFQRTGEVLPKPEEAQKFRKATADAEQLTNKLTRLRQLVNDNGSFEYGGKGGTEMESLATEIQLLAKGEDMYQLGVLTGPDLNLLQKITADPASLSSMFTRDSTRRKQIDTQLTSIQDKLQSRAKSMGYRKAGESQGESNASSPPVNIIDPTGRVRSIPADQVKSALANGGRLAN